jgi:hypothetical protein
VGGRRAREPRARMRVLELLVVAAVALAAAGESQLRGAAAPAERQLALADLLAKLPPQVQAELKELQAKIPADLKAKIEAFIAKGKAELEALIAKLKGMAAAPDAAGAAAAQALMGKVMDAANANKALDPATLAAVQKLLPAGATLPATLTVAGVANAADNMAAKHPLDVNMNAQLKLMVSTGAMPQIGDIMGKLQQAMANGLTAEQCAKVMAALNAGKAVDAQTQAALQKALNGAPLPLMMKIDKLQALVGALPAEDKAKINALLAQSGQPDLDALITKLRDAVANGMPKALASEVLSAVSASVKIDASVSVQVQAYLAPGEELPRSFVQGAAADAGANGASGPSAGVIAAASIASVLVVGAAVVTVQKRRKAAAEMHEGKRQVAAQQW